MVAIGDGGYFYITQFRSPVNWFSHHVVVIFTWSGACYAVQCVRGTAHWHCLVHYNLRGAHSVVLILLAVMDGHSAVQI